MGKKIIYIALIIIFIISLIFINFILQKETQNALSEEGKEILQSEKENNNIQILKITEENFESEVLQSDKTVLIDFYADWCGPCKVLSPIVEEFASENPDIKVVKVNVEEAQNLAINYEVMSIPTLVVIKDGKEVNRTIGVVNKSEIVSLTK